MNTQGKITGFKGLSKLLNQLPDKVENRVLQGATIGAIRVAAKEMRAAAPRDLDDQSPASKQYGRLSKNIRVKRLRRVKRGQKGARVDTGNAFWGRFLEFGTRYIPAHPWFAPAFRKSYEAMLRELSERILTGITKEALKLRDKT